MVVNFSNLNHSASPERSGALRVLNECIFLAASKDLSGRIVEIPIHGRILKPYFNAIALGHGLPAQLIFAGWSIWSCLLYKRWEGWGVVLIMR